MKNVWFIFLIQLLILDFGYSKNPDKPFKKIIREVTQLPVQRIRIFINRPDLNKEKVKYGNDDRQYFYICHPKQSNGKAIFFVHGGGWHIGKPAQHFILAKILIEKGFTVVLPAYRLAIGSHNVLTQREDITQAFLLAKEKIQNKNINQWIIGGASAGGNLSALLAFDEDLQNQNEICVDDIIGYFSFAGALDISQMRKSRTLKSFAGNPNSTTFLLANPAERLPEFVKFPTLIIHGTDDGLVEPQSVTNFCQKFCAIACENLEFHFLQDYNHVEVTSKWYYKTESCQEPKKILIDWLNRICEK